MILSISSTCILFALNSTAASFDCSKASTYVEKEICRNENISTLDDNLNAQYKSLMNQSDENAKATLKSSQKKWLSSRNKCGSGECIETAYNTRIAQLSELSGNNIQGNRGNQITHQGTPDSERSCIKEIGKKKAKALVNWCLDVSPATRPPCNVANSSKMIVEEIDRACKLHPDIFSCQAGRWCIKTSQAEIPLSPFFQDAVISTRTDSGIPR